eukprot:GILK01010263.1.p1 GENE.GILK01010263.1~~GILK01010263.1.p1  ORF type:complete len:941 (-),score=162.74 GILK01010263.1:396-3218(-)
MSTLSGLFPNPPTFPSLLPSYTEYALDKTKLLKHLENLRNGSATSPSAADLIRSFLDQGWKPISLQPLTSLPSASSAYSSPLVPMSPPSSPGPPSSPSSSNPLAPTSQAREETQQRNARIFKDFAVLVARKTEFSLSCIESLLSRQTQRRLFDAIFDYVQIHRNTAVADSLLSAYETDFHRWVLRTFMSSSRDMKESCMQDDEDKTAQSFLLERSKNRELDSQLLYRIHCELGEWFLFCDLIDEAKQHFQSAMAISKNLSIPTAQELRLQGFLTALASFHTDTAAASTDMFREIEVAIADKDWDATIRLLDRDIGRKELPIYYRIHLESKLTCDDSISKRLIINNAVRQLDSENDVLVVECIARLISMPFANDVNLLHYFLELVSTSLSIWDQESASKKFNKSLQRLFNGLQRVPGVQSSLLVCVESYPNLIQFMSSEPVHDTMVVDSPSSVEDQQVPLYLQVQEVVRLRTDCLFDASLLPAALRQVDSLLPRINDDMKLKYEVIHTKLVLLLYAAVREQQPLSADEQTMWLQSSVQSNRNFQELCGLALSFPDTAHLMFELIQTLISANSSVPKAVQFTMKAYLGLAVSAQVAGQLDSTRYDSPPPCSLFNSAFSSSAVAWSVMAPAWNTLKNFSSSTTIVEDIEISKERQMKLWNALKSVFEVIQSNSLIWDPDRGLLHHVVSVQFLDQLSSVLTAVLRSISLRANSEECYTLTGGRYGPLASIFSSSHEMSFDATEMSSLSSAVRTCLTAVLDRLLQLCPKHPPFLLRRADLHFTQEQYSQAIRLYLLSGAIESSFYSDCKIGTLPSTFRDESVILNMIKALTAVDASVPAAILYQFLSEPDLTAAFRMLQESPKKHSVTYLRFIWDTSLLELLIFLHSRAKDKVKESILVRNMEDSALNAHNPIAIRSAASNRLHWAFLRQLAADFLLLSSSPLAT